MSFPQDVTTFLQAQDPSTVEDVQGIVDYQTALANEDFAGASDILANMANGTVMHLNASRFNEVVNEITAIENFYLNGDGQGGVAGYINSEITAYSIIGVYDATTTYPQGAIAQYDGQWFKSLQASNQGNTPTSTIGTYWDYFIQPQSAIQYQIASSQPAGLSNGDLWFREL